MRRILFSAVVAIALVFAVMPTAVADTGGPEVGDLGLDGITISRLAVLKSGDVRVAGTIQCSEDLEWVEVQFALRQDVGRFHTVFGYGWDDIACSADVGSSTFSVVVEPDQGRFGPNRAQFEGGAFVEQCWWDPDEEDEICVWDEAWIGPTIMKVRRGR